MALACSTAISPIQGHGAGPPTVQASDRGRSKTPVRHGAVGVFLRNGRKFLGCSRKREGMQHGKREVELLLDTRVAGDGKMNLSELLNSVCPWCLKGGHGDEQAGHQCTVPQLSHGFEDPPRKTKR